MRLEERIAEALAGHYRAGVAEDAHQERLATVIVRIVREAQDRVGKRYAELHQMRSDEMQAKAWDEGERAGFKNRRRVIRSGHVTHRETNPYREAGGA